MTAPRIPTARDDLGVVFVTVLAAAYVLLMVSFIGSNAPASAPRDITGDTAAPAVLFNGGHQ